MIDPMLGLEYTDTKTLKQHNYCQQLARPSLQGGVNLVISSLCCEAIFIVRGGF